MSDSLKQQFRAYAQGSSALHVAFIGVVNGLFEALNAMGFADAADLARRTGLDTAYVARWCDAAYAFEYLDEHNGRFCLTERGQAMRPSAPQSLMPIAVHAMLGAHMAERAAAFMRTGERPGEQVVAERETILPWFGAMLEGNFAPLFESTICPAVPAFAEVNSRSGFAVDLGCGNGWYLRALARRFPNLRGLGLDGFAENIAQARRLAEAEGFSHRLDFVEGDILADFKLPETADLIAMNRALHHVWDRRETLFPKLRSQLKAGGFVVIWEPNWPSERGMLRDPSRRGMAFQNLTEHIQGNHLLQADEIVAAFREAGMPAELYLFANGNEAIIVGRNE